VDADRFLVDAALTADEQAASLGQTWRSNLRKSEKAGLDVADLDFTDYSEFVAIYDRMAQRKQVTLYGPVDVVPELRATLPEEMRPLGVIARHEGEAVAGVIYARIGDMAYYMFGATNDKALPVRAGYALQWAVLDKLRGTTRWYDLGGAPEPGLRQFKSGFVGKAGVVVTLPGEFDYAAGPRAKLALRLISAVRMARDLIRSTLKALRRMGRPPAKAASGPSAPAA
jgi:lipid II:glycine glycyltransferase (peptidoglycan interpeptide bridge formation enzyme)